MLLHHRDLTNRGHAHHHRLVRSEEGGRGSGEEWWKCEEKKKKKKKKQWRKELAATHAEIPGSSSVNIRQCRRNLMRENGQTSQHKEGSFIYLLLDIAVGNWNRTWGSVDEVLVGGDLIGLHRSCCTV